MNSSHERWAELKRRMFSATFGALLTTITGKKQRQKQWFVSQLIPPFTLLVTPLDVVKVRLQASKTQHKSTTSAALGSIFRNEGLLSLYRGFLPAMAMSLPGTVIYFVGYERIREGLDGSVLDGPFVPLLAGASARILSAGAVSPLELVRTRMQFAGRDQGRLSVVCAELFAAMKRDGLRPLWKGLQPTLWRDVPFSGIYWLFLEQSRRRLFPRLADDSFERAAASFACGAGSGALAAVLTTPFDVAKTRQQVLFNRSSGSGSFFFPRGLEDAAGLSTLAQLRAIWRAEGATGLMSGVVPRVGKVAPACAIMIGSYELGKHIFREIEH